MALRPQNRTKANAKLLVYKYVTNFTPAFVRAIFRCSDTRVAHIQSAEVFMSTSTMSQKAARDGLGSPDLFKGGVFVTKNGTAELFIQTAAEREEELAQREHERQTSALVRLVMLAKQDVNNGRTMSCEEVLKRLQDARK